MTSSPRPNPLAHPSVAWLLLPLVACLGSPAVSAESAKVDPQLSEVARAAPDESLTVWVALSDKGEGSPADLARRLADAEAGLAPRARARRVRAGLRPLVDERDLPVERAYLERLAPLGRRVGVSRWLNAVGLRTPGREIERLDALPFVRRLSLLRLTRTSPDPPPLPVTPGRTAPVGRVAVDYGLTASQIAQIGVPALHDSGYTAAGVLVCVLDAGFNYFDKHEALRDIPIPPELRRDFYRGSTDVQDTLDFTMVHGTQVLGCIAGRKLGTYVGTAYGADFALARTEVAAFESPDEMIYWAMGAEWADSLGASVISSSLAYSTFAGHDTSYAYADMNGHTTIVSRAAEVAAAKGILVVNAVGNDGLNSWHYLSAPSDVHGDSVLAIGAVNSIGTPAGFSSYGPSADGRVKPDLAARGLGVAVVAVNGNPSGYTTNDGTSFATPLVAGLAACLLQARPNWSPSQVARSLKATASRAGSPDNRVGYGVPDGAAVLGGSFGSGPFVRLTNRGANPAVFSRGPVRIRVEPGAAACGRSARARVLDLMGRRVRTLWSGVVSCATFSDLEWDGLDEGGHRIRPGVYVVELSAGSDRATLRVVVVG